MITSIIIVLSGVITAIALIVARNYQNHYHKALKENIKLRQQYGDSQLNHIGYLEMINGRVDTLLAKHKQELASKDEIIQYYQKVNKN